MLSRLKNKLFLRFLIPSLIGAFLFVTPINQDGNLTIPIAVAANALLDFMGDHADTVIWLLISLSAVLTILHKTVGIGLLKRNPKLNNLFDVKGFWLIVRIIGFVFVNMIYFGIGPDIIIGDLTGSVVMGDLLPILVCVFLLAGLLLALLLNYGLLDFLGALMIKLMRPVFNLPGRSALDCVASWLGDGSIGVLLTSKQYEEGFYSKREATVIATTFSAVSITFSLVVISEVGLEHMFLPFYGVVSFAGIVAAIIVPKLRPLSKVPDSYYTETPHREDIPQGMSAARYGMQLALKKAEKAPGIKAFFLEGAENVFEMWFGTLPVILAMGTIALIIAEFTPVFKILGLPFILLYKLLQIPEAELASQTVIVGFADMFLPSVIGSSIQSELTRFVIAATSVTQLIYMSEIGSIIMGSKIPVSLKDLFIIFLQRTVVTLPVIAIFAHLLF
ncbi:MAG: YjiH family protein [Oscillospiraceae bacterium]|jgi:nucleoside recognition membrane protein YjiH|nr:YjiH family protein [Oscillospiraceae bacterium]